jgi:hypothetical protein
MAIQFYIRRQAGHPWDSRPGFDILEVISETQDELEIFDKKARLKFWQTWIMGVDDASGKPAAVYYKPSGVKAEWQDSPINPHPGCHF